MSVGYAITKADIDNSVGNGVVQLLEGFERMMDLKGKLDLISDQELGEAPYDYTPDEVALLRASLTDIAALDAVAYGRQAQPEPSNFFWNARLLTGLSGPSVP